MEFRNAFVGRGYDRADPAVITLLPPLTVSAVTNILDPVRAQDPRRGENGYPVGEVMTSPYKAKSI